MTESKEECNMAILEQKLDRVLILAEQTHTAIFGNNSSGIKSRLCVVEDSLRRAWWFFGIVFLIAGGVITTIMVL